MASHLTAATSSEGIESFGSGKVAAACGGLWKRPENLVGTGMPELQGPATVSAGLASQAQVQAWA